MKNFKILNLLYLVLIFCMSSCITQKEVQYLQPSESLVINEEGLVPYNVPEYRITKGDILSLNIVTTPKGDAAQFYSALNTNSGQNLTPPGTGVTRGREAAENPSFYFNGLKVNSQGEVYIFGIGFVKVEGRTLEDVTEEIQIKVNENFLQGKSEVRLNLDGIRYYVLGDIESTGVTGDKVAYTTQLNIMQAIAMNGGLNRTVDRKKVRIHRKYPEGIKTVVLDLTREDIMNSPYYWIQNGDIVYLNTNKKSINGFGKAPLQTLTTAASVITTLLSLYLILDRVK